MIYALTVRKSINTTTCNDRSTEDSVSTLPSEWLQIHVHHGIDRTGVLPRWIAISRPSWPRRSTSMWSQPEATSAPTHAGFPLGGEFVRLAAG